MYIGLFDRFDLILLLPFNPGTGWTRNIKKQREKYPSWHFIIFLEENTPPVGRLKIETIMSEIYSWAWYSGSASASLQEAVGVGSSSSSSGAGLPGGDNELDEDRLDLEVTVYFQYMCTVKIMVN